MTSVAHGQSAEPPVFVGAIGPRQADLDKLIRQLEAKTSTLVFAYEADRAGTACIATCPVRASTAASSRLR